MPIATFGRWLQKIVRCRQTGRLLEFHDAWAQWHHTVGLAEAILQEDWVIDEIWARAKEPIAFYRQTYWWTHLYVFVLATPNVQEY